MFNRTVKSLTGSALLATALVSGSVPVLASDAAIVYKQATTEDATYCHIKYMAMTPQSLQSGVPEFNPSEIIDMYGPCNFDPQSPEERRRQVEAMNRGLYGDSGSDGGSGD